MPMDMNKKDDMNTVAIPLDSVQSLKPVSRRCLDWAKRCWAMFLLATMLPLAASAQTNVTGAITANTRWTVANAPYVVNGDVVIQNSAVLTLDPGVTVYMGTNASLTVEAGGMVASGTTANPIRVLSDKTRQGQTAAAGDWKQWVFNAGTTNTRLDNVIFEHGSGLAVKGSAPVFNYLNIRNQQGAAISVDLTASPSGVGNQASGNTINGILVPVGDIGGNVRWGLRGIPYVVPSGMLSVGASPKVNTVSPNSLQQGETTTIILSGSRLSGLSEVKFDRSGIRAQIMPGVSDTQASLSVTADATASLGAASMRLLVDAGEIEISNALTLIQSQPVLTDTLPNSLYSGQGTVNLTVNGRNFTSQSVVLVNGMAVETQFLSATQLRSTIAVPTVPGSLMVRVRTPDPLNAGQLLNSNELVVPVLAPPTLQITPSAVTMGVGRTIELTIQSSLPAGGNGLAVNLVSSDVAVATVPATATIPAGSSSVKVAVASQALGTAKITAQASDYVSGETTINVRQLSLSLPGNALVAPGVARSIPLTLSDPAPAGGLTINFASSDTTVVAAPVSVTVPAGQTSVNFTVNGLATGSATITASAESYQSAALPVTVETVTISIGSPAATAISLSAETVLRYSVNLSKPAPAGGITISLATADGAVASVTPSSITIAEGQTSGGAAILTVTGLVKGSTALLATSAGLNSATIPITVGNKAELAFSKNSVMVGKGLKTYIHEVYVFRKVDGAGYSPNQALTVTLSSANGSKVGVPETVTIPAGQYSAYFTVTGIDLTGEVPVMVDASASGYSSPATKLAANVVTPVLNFSELDANRSTSSPRDNLRVYVTVPGAAYQSNQTAASDLPVNLSIVEANPAGMVDGFYNDLTGGAAVTQVLLRADSTYSDYAFVGAPTAAGSYKVQASMAGVSNATSAAVTVTGPQLRLITALNGYTTVVGKGLKTYHYEVRVERVANGAAFNGSEALTVNLSSADGNKVSVPATVTIPAGQSTAYFYVTGVELTGEVPVTIDASASGYGAPATKLAVSVVAPMLNFSEVDTNRSPASTRDNLRIYVTVPGANYPSYQTAASDLPVSLAIVDADPAGIVDGFYGALSGGTAVAQVLLRKDSAYSEYAYVGVPTAAGSYKVQAGLSGASATSGVVTVSSPQLRFVSALNTSSMVVGKGLKNYLAEVRVERVANGAAFNGGDALTVNLSSADGSKVSVPATVTIPAGQSAANFYVTGVELTGGTAVMIDASASGYSAPASKLGVNVVTPVLNFNELDSNRTQLNARDNVRWYVTVPGATYSSNQTAASDLPIALSIVEANPAGIVDGFYSAATGGTPVTQVLLRTGNTYSDYAYVGIPTAEGAYKVQANMGGVSSATSGAVTVSSPQLRFVTASSVGTLVVGKGLKTYLNEVRVERVANGTAFNGNDALTVSLACAAATICKTPASVIIPAGQSSVNFQVEGLAIGSTVISGSAAAYISPSDVAVNVIVPQLNFSGPSTTKAGQQSNFYVYLTTPGAVYGNQTALAPITFNLTSNAPNIATVPATATIPAGYANTGNIALTGVAAGTFTLTASGTDLSSATSSVVTINP